MKIKDTAIRFIKSIVIKIDEVGMFINSELNKIYGEDKRIFINEDRSTWKYYKNLSGDLHILDEISLPDGIIIDSLDTNEKIKLTKEVIKEHPKTLLELNKFNIYYNNIVKKYPNQELYIKGIIYNLELDYIINSKNHNIIAYDESLLEPNEITLINRLNSFIEDYFKRWFIIEYTITDDLYLSTFLENLYGALVTEFINYRIGNIYTAEVSNEFIYEFFKSNSNIANNVNRLDIKSKVWLYKNYRQMINNIGHSSNIIKINENILRDRGIKLYRVNINKKKINDNIENVLMLNDINNEFSNTEINHSLILRKQSNLSNLEDRDIKNIIDKIDNFKNSNYLFQKEPSKIFVLSISNYLDRFIVSKYKLMLDYLTNISYGENSSFKIKFTEPNTKKIFNLNIKEIVLLLNYFIVKFKNIDDFKITKLKTNTIPSNYLSIDHINDYYKNIDIVKNNSEFINSKIVNKKRINNIKELREDFSNILKSYGDVNYRYSNSTNGIEKFYISEMFDLITEDREFVLTNKPKTFKELLKENKIILEEFNTFNYYNSIVTLLEDIFNIKVNDYVELNKMVDDYIEILKSVSSYTEQFLDNKIEKFISIEDNKINLLYDFNASKIENAYRQCMISLNNELYFRCGKISKDVKITNHSLLNSKIIETYNKCLFSYTDFYKKYGIYSQENIITVTKSKCFIEDNILKIKSLEIPETINDDLIKITKSKRITAPRIHLKISNKDEVNINNKITIHEETYPRIESSKIRVNVINSNNKVSELNSNVVRINTSLGIRQLTGEIKTVDNVDDKKVATLNAKLSN